jgi:hypothetical protein
MWIGLPSSAEGQLLRMTGQRVLSSLAVIQDAAVSDELVSITADDSQSSHNDELVAVKTLIDKWLQIIQIDPSLLVLNSSKPTASAVERSLMREINTAIRFTTSLRSDLLSLR